MHDDIKKYYMSGAVSDHSIVATRTRLIHFLEGQMRDSGYVPVLDMEPQFTLDYNSDEEQYTFELTIYGARCESPWQVSGVTNGKPIPSALSKSLV